MPDTNQPPSGSLDPLTPRELEILAHLVAKRTNPEIAEKESLALSSVKWYVNQILSKLGVSSRGEAAARAQELGLIKTTPVRNNLPRSLTSFIGREAEIEKVLELVRAHPLVTVTGSGGTGKTRLALQTAEKALAFFPDGAWLVELAPLADRELFPQAVLSAIGLSETPGLAISQILSDYFRPRQALILLDNCEHVIGAAAGLAHELLRACPRLHILATSREILGAEGEVPFRCPSLALPDSQQALSIPELNRVESIKLFVERAQIPAPGFELNETTAMMATWICQRLDGIPLAIELAAARLRLLSLEQIASRLDDVYRLLTGGSRTDLPRHQTLKALIDWSYNLLSEKERLLLLRLSVFAGDWTVEAAETVCADEALPKEEVLDLLGQLLDKSLVGMEAKTKSGQPRYSMLETIRQYAHERLVENGGRAEARERHLDYYLDLSLRAEPELHGKNLRWWQNLLDEEIDNLRLAVEWALNGPLEKGLRLAAALTRYLMARHIYDGIQWLQSLLAAEAKGELEQRGQPERLTARARALTALALVGGGGVDRLPLAQESTAIFKVLGPAYMLDWALALSIWSVKDLHEILALFRQAGDLFGVTEALWPLILEAFSTGELAQARIYAEESLALNRQIGYLDGEFTLLYVLANLELLEGNQTRALDLFNASLDLLQDTGEVGSVLEGDFTGRVALINGDYTRARHIFEEGLDAAQAIGFNGDIFSKLDGLAWTAWASDDFHLIEQCCREMERFSSHVSKDNLSVARYTYARLAISRGEYGLAFECLVTLTEHWNSFLMFIPIQLLIHAFGILAAAQGQHRRAAVLFGAQDFIARNLMNIVSPREREEYQRALAAAQSGLGEEEFARATAEGKALSLEDALRYAVEDRE